MSLKDWFFAIPLNLLFWEDVEYCEEEFESQRKASFYFDAYGAE